MNVNIFDFLKCHYGYLIKRFAKKKICFSVYFNIAWSYLDHRERFSDYFSKNNQTMTSGSILNSKSLNLNIELVHKYNIISWRTIVRRTSIVGLISYKNYQTLGDVKNNYYLEVYYTWFLIWMWILSLILKKNSRICCTLNG